MRLMTLGFATVLSAATVQAQQTASPLPAPRALPAPSIVSPKFAGSAFNLIVLENGNILINDTRNHRVMLSDSLLKNTTVVIDSMDYGSRPGSLIRYPGDSIVFIEAITPSMKLLDPTGKVVRTMAVPRPRDAGWLMPTPAAMAGVDARGRFVHRGVAPRPQFAALKPGEVRKRDFPDSNPVVRDDPITHAGDTIAWIKSIALKGTEVARADGRTMMYMRSIPAETIDEWAVLSNGSLAVVRGRDYHIDLIGADGKSTTLPRIPYAWERITDEMKTKLIDSARVERDKARNGPPMSMGSGGVTGGGSGGGGGGGVGVGASNAPSGFPDPPPGSQDAEPNDIPDYRPVFGLGSLIPDAEGNLWIRTLHPVADTTVTIFDVIDVTGKRIDRVLMPKNRTIVGFDKRGNVFVVGKEDGGIQWIERVRWRR